MGQESCHSFKSLTHTAEHDRCVHKGAEAPGRDFGWPGSHLHTQQSSSAAVGIHRLTFSFLVTHVDLLQLNKLENVGKSLQEAAGQIILLNILTKNYGQGFACYKGHVMEKR